MNPISALIASTGLCASRTFLPAFIAAVMLRLGADQQVVRDAAGQLIGGGGHIATWFTSDTCLIVLGLLSALEIAAQRNHDARSVLVEIDHYGKPVMAVVTALGLLSQTDADFATKLSQQHAQHAGLITPFIAMCAGFGTYVVAGARNEVHRLLHDADSENSTGIHGLLAWAEDAWVAMGMFLFVFFPIFMAGMIGAGIGIILLLQRRARIKEEAAKIPCTSCQVPMYRSALQCPGCRSANPTPCSVNWLGVATHKPADPATHPFNLLTKRRCPSCASRLAERTARQSCAACSTTIFADPASVTEYDAAVSARLVPTLIVTAVMGLVPIFGLIAGVIYYRLHLIAPYRAYLPRTKNILLRWGIRLLMFGLLLLHLIPVIGCVAAPVMAFINFGIYRGAFLAEADQETPVHSGVGTATIVPAL